MKSSPTRWRADSKELSNRWRIVAQIRARCVDLAILFPRSFEAALWVTLARVPRRVGVVGDARGPLLTNKPVLGEDASAGHQGRRYLSLVRQVLGIEGDIDDCTPDLTQIAAEEVVKSLRDLGTFE